MTEFALKPPTDASALLADWRRLYERAGEKSFFLSPAWMEAWLGGRPGGATLFCLEAKDGGETVLLGIVADAPQYPPFLGLRETWFHEFGAEAPDAVYVEYNDFLVSPSAPADIRQQAVNYLIERHGARDAFVFRNLRPEMARAVHAAAGQSRCVVRLLREQPVYVCRLGDGRFLEGLSRSLQAKIRRAMRLYEERGALVGRVVSQGDEFDAAWGEMTALHAEGWRARGQKAVFDNPHLVAFHERLRKTAPEAAHLFAVKAGDMTIAVLYNFVDEDRVMNYQGGFLFEDDNRLAPGFVAHALAAQHYGDAGYKVYDLLAGEADYKKRLGTQETTLTSLVVERPTWRNRSRRALKSAKNRT